MIARAGRSLRAGVVALVLIAGAALYLVHAVRREGEALRERIVIGDVDAARARMAKFLDADRLRHADDRKHLAALSSLVSSGAKSDAGPVLNAMLEWPVPWPSRPRPPLRIPDDVQALIGDWSAERLEALSKIDLSKIDLSWMAQLSDFNHWDLERNSPYDDVSEDDFATEWFVDREPRLEALTSWVKLRLMKGFREHEIWDALSESRQLARLLLSTESLLGTVEAIVIESILHQAYVASLAGDAEEVQDWRSVGTQEELAGAIRAARALPFALTPMSPQSHFDRAIADKGVGFCAALRESATRALWLRPLVEKANEPYYVALDRLIATGGAGCRLTMLKRAFHAPDLARRWRFLGQVGGEGMPLDSREPPPLQRLALFASPDLRLAVGSRFLANLVDSSVGPLLDSP